MIFFIIYVKKGKKQHYQPPAPPIEKKLGTHQLLC